MEKQLNVGLIGYGFAGRVLHAPVITSIPGLNLKKVVERRSDYSKERYPWVEVVRSANDLYIDPEIDVIVITTPSTNHVEFVRDALSNGKHVVVEKPFTATTEEADELIELAKERNRVLSVFHNRRWDGDFMTIREIIKNGLIGKVKECEVHWDSFNPIALSTNWREKSGIGTGVLYDLGVHLFDQALCLFGVPNTISADVQIQREGAKAHDYFDLTLGYDHHLKVTLKSSRIVRTKGPRYILHGDKGSFIKFGLDPQEQALIDGRSPANSKNWGREPEELWGSFETTAGGLNVKGAIETIPGAYQDYYQNIYDHITGTADLAVKPEEARMNIRLIELAIESHKLGKVLPVSI
ncbi:oxidoreductase [Bacillus sp. FJAT-49870]|uniref:Oxidoreductase n=1 Tax=Lederbergia citri TaxID=2833580 RepID=A0A942T967_9BACI|nr:oxidoreductase [Lederbergia citri]